MRSRSWVCILVIGILGLTAMGLLTKLAVDSNPELQKMIAFKAAMAQEFSSRGVSELELQKLSGRHGYKLILTRKPAASKNAGELDGALAEYFAANFWDKSATVLSLSYVPPVFWGCEGAKAYRESEIPLTAVRMAIEDKARRGRIALAFSSGFQVNLISEEWKERRVILTVEPLRGFSGDPLELLRKLESLCRSDLQRARHQELTMRLKTADGLVTEARFDPRGKEPSADADVVARPLADEESGLAPAPAGRKLFEDLALLALAISILIVPAVLRSVRGGPLRVEERALKPLRIDINKAPYYEWMLLEGIGESRARGVVEYREGHGPFESIDELKAVPRMPEGWVEKSKPHLQLGDEMPRAPESGSTDGI